MYVQNSATADFYTPIRARQGGDPRCIPQDQKPQLPMRYDDVANC